MATPVMKKSIHPWEPVEARCASRSKRLMRSGMIPKHRSRSDQKDWAYFFSVARSPVARHTWMR